MTSKLPALGLRIFVAVAAIAISALVVYLCVPYAPKTAAELCGDYVLDCELIRKNLTLHPDGNFTETVLIKATGEVLYSKGTWKYVTELSSGVTFGTLRLRDCVSVLERPDKLRQDYAKQKPGNGFMPAEYWFGRLILGRADDWPVYRKQ